MTAPFDNFIPVRHSVRRLQDRRQPGQLHLAGHGRQAEGGSDQAAGAHRSWARRSSPARSATTVGTTSTNTARMAACRASAVHRVFQGRLAGPLGRRRDAAVGRRAEPHGGDARAAGRSVRRGRWYHRQDHRLVQEDRRSRRRRRCPERGTRSRLVDRRRRRPDGAGADRGVRSRCPRSRWPRRSTLPAARRRAATRASASAARRVCSVGHDVAAALLPCADVLIDFTRPDGHACACGGLRRHRRRRGRRHHRTDDAQKAAISRCAQRCRSSTRPT